MEDLNKSFDKKFSHLSHIGCNNEVPCGDIQMEIKSFIRQREKDLLKKVVEQNPVLQSAKVIEKLEELSSD